MKNQKKSKKIKKSDPLLALKYVGYCWAHTPPGDETTLEDLVNFAKFFLCKKANRLWKDLIWNEYTNEEILIEYFAHLFAQDASARTEFEVQMNVGTQIYGEDIFDWLDRKVKENQVETARKIEAMPDKVSFSPEQNEDSEV